MKILKCWFIGGKNVYSDKSVVVSLFRFYEAEQQLFKKRRRSTVAKLIKLFPEIKQEKTSRVANGKTTNKKFSLTSDLGELVLFLGEVLLKRLDFPATGSFIVKSDRPYFTDFYLVIECEYPRSISRTGLGCFQAAIRIIERLVRQKDPRLDAEWKNLLRKRTLEKLSPKTQLVLEEAAKKNLPVMHLAGKSLYQIGYGKNQLRINGSNLNNEVGTELANQKHFFKEFFRRVAGGSLVPQGSEVQSAAEAVVMAKKIGFPVVVKPCEGSFGRSVTVNIENEKEVRKAYAVAKRSRKGVIVEKFFAGFDYRLTLVDYQLVAATHRIPARVVGDGRRTIAELIEAENKNNPARRDSFKSPLKKIKVDGNTLKVLRGQGYNFKSVLPAGEKAFVRGNANISTGGESVDVTKLVNPQTVTLLSFMTRLLGLRVVGVDVICQDIAKSPFEGDWVLIEVNSRPDIEMHHYPYRGKKINVAEKIIEMILPAIKTSRIPIYSVTGTNGKTTTTRMISHLLQQAGRKVSFTTTGSVSIGKSQVYNLGSGSTSARAILMDPTAENAVLETAHLGILGGGLAYSQSDVSVVTNVREDHLGEFDLSAPLNNIRDILRIKSVVARGTAPDGVLIVNADDRYAKPIVRAAAGAKIVFFSLSNTNPIIKEQLRKGEEVYFIKNGVMYRGKNKRLMQIIKISQILSSRRGRIKYNVANALAAAAATLSHPKLGIKPKYVKQGLKNFGTTFEENPGRLNIVKFPGFRVIIDYAHNPDGYRNVLAAVENMSRKRMVGVIKAAGDRTNEVIQEIGRIAGENFDKLYVKDPSEEKIRGRKAGQVAALLARGAKEAGVASENIIIELDEIRATNRAVKEAKPGDLVIIFAHDIQKVYQTVMAMQKKFINKALRRNEKNRKQ